MHVCLTEEEKAWKNQDHNIASQATITQRLREWAECESLLREFAKSLGMRNSRKVKVPRITKKLCKSQYLSPEAEDFINNLFDLVKQMENRPAESWFTGNTMDYLGSSIGNLRVLLDRITIANTPNG
jgi:hypothetical protein